MSNKNPEWLADKHMPFMKSALCMMHVNHATELQHLRLVVSPQHDRDVIAKTNINKSKLVLVPVSQHIVVAEKHPTFLEAGVAFKHPVRGVDIRMFIGPTFAPGTVPDRDGKLPAKIVTEMLVPFWYVNATPDPNDANMENAKPQRRSRRRGGLRARVGEP